eukprot:g27128.t1
MEVLVYMFTSGFAKTLISAWTYTCVAGAVGAFLAEVRTFAAKNSRVDPWVQAQAGAGIGAGANGPAVGGWEEW